MEEKSEESMVKMQSYLQISPPLSTSMNPTKRHCYRDDSSVAWYNLEKSHTLKTIRCMEHLKHPQQENAVKSSIQSEQQEDEDEDEDEDELSSSKPTSSTSTEPESPATDLEDPGSKEVSKSSEDQNRDELDSIKRELLAFDVKELSQSPSLGDTMSHLPPPVYVGLHDAKETALIDVHLTADATSAIENVPFVCLISKLNSKAILGHPLEVGELSDSSETSLSRNETVAPKLFHHLVWRKSKRTPVCYVTNSLFSVSGNSQAVQTSINVSKLIPLPRANTKSFAKFQKNSNQFKKERAAASKTCIPVVHIFSKIFAALGQVQS
ncbi:hypothetical protein ACJIZ3_004216 [Penstemon smallii]|uniref:Uncharacterized protein n=1 Tax=Penstemon smallii TaxID=265156 RepID=A0ABD3S1G2_9LAMI